MSDTKSRLLVLAALAITASSAHAAVLGEERAPARLAKLGGVVAAALAEPQSDRAEMVGYALGSQEAPQPLVGQVTLRAVLLDSTDVFSMHLREPRRFHPESCAFASYSGTFLGMILPPGETTTSADPFIAPRQ